MRIPPRYAPHGVSRTARLRLAKGWTQDELAAALKRTKTHVSMVENASPTSVATLELFAAALGIPARTYATAYFADREAAHHRAKKRRKVAA